MMNEAQFSKNKGHLTATLIGRTGPVRLILPVSQRGRRPLRDLIVHEPERSASKTFRTCAALYGRCSGWSELKASFEVFLTRLLRPRVSAAEIGFETLRWTLDVVGAGVGIAASDELVAERSADASEWIARLVEAVDGTDYLQGRASMDAYFRREPFERRGVRIWCQDFSCRNYGQLDGSFRPVISILDPLFVAGVAATRAMIGVDRPKGGGETVRPWP